MCVSTSLNKDYDEVEFRTKRRFQIPLEYTPYYYRNGFAHENLYIIPMDDPGGIMPSIWGLVPDFGMFDIPAFHKKYNTLNARSETVFTSNTYKHSIHDKRCLIIADGFHEPHRHNGISYPFYCHYQDSSIFCFAGLFTEIDDELFSCSIITVPANEQFEYIHNQKKRMPLVLDSNLENDWLDPDLHEPAIKEILNTGFTSKAIEAYPVSRDLYKRGIDRNTPIAVTNVDYPELQNEV